MREIHKVLKELFPSHYQCLICKREMPAEERYSLCTDCKSKLPYVSAPCEKCGRQTHDNYKFCEECRRNKRYFDVARSRLIYKGGIRKAYLEYKTGDNQFAGEFYASFLLDEYLANGFHCDGICAIPSYKKSKRATLNHAEYLAKQLSIKTGLPLLDGLHKRANVKKQVGLSGKERRQNLVDAFYADKDAFRGKTVLLVDDVFTTGSTLNYAAKALKEDGKAKAVVGLTIFSVDLSDKESENETIAKSGVKK